MGPSLFIFAYIFIQFARYVNIKLISSILNRYRTKNKINTTYRFMMWFSGFRGAMAFALSLKSIEDYHETGAIMLTITLLFAITNV